MPNLYALLVGINDYAPESRVPSLRGCTDDVHSLHRQLTRHFSTPAAHVRRLTNHEATLAAVVEGWRSHLRDQVRPGDVAYFHYSGHGSQALSSDPGEPDGLDETLALWDSRLPGGSDLRDKQLAGLIAEVEAAGAQVILFLDCCHAGGATRADEAGAVRACPPDLRPHSAVAGTEAHTRAAARFPDAEPASGQRHVVLAACLDEEKAREVQVDGVWHGAATACFLRALESATALTTWSDIHAQLVVGVRTLLVRQTPQLTGPRATLLWGGGGALESAPLVVLAADGAGGVELDGGAAIGLSTGARVAIFRAGAPAADDPLAFATVTTAAADSAVAKLESVMVVPVASRARIVSYGYASPVFPVRVDDADVAAVLAQGEARFVRAVTTPAAPFAVSVVEGRYQICDSAGEPLIEERPAVGRDGAARVVRLLEHMAVYRNVRTLRNRAAGPSLAGMLEIGAPVAVKSSRGSYAALGEAQPLPLKDGLPALRINQPIALNVTNLSAQRLFVTILRLGPDYSIRKVEPVEERQTTLPAGRSLLMRDRLEADRDATRAAAANGTVLYKVMATTTPVSFDALLLPPIGQSETTRSAPVRDTGPLSALLDALRRTGTRPAAAEVREDLWIAQDVLVAIAD